MKPRTLRLGALMASRMISLLSIAVSALGMEACTEGPGGILGVGPVQSESRTLEPFHAVSVDGSLRVKWSPGNASVAVVEAQGNVLPHLKTVMVDGTLKIYLDCSLTSDVDETVTLTSPGIDEVNLDGSGTVSAAGVTGKTIKAGVTGSGQVDLSGEVESWMGEVTGSGDLVCDNLKAQDADVTVTGSGDATVSVSGQLNANVVGSGSVNYTGNPKNVSQRVVGSGSVGPK